MIFISPPTDFKPALEVTSCFITHKGTYLLLQRTSSKKIQPGTWGSPAGKIEAGEDRLTATLREIKEETGLTVNKHDLHFFDTIYVRYPEEDFVYHMYSVEYDTQPKITITSEHQDFRWVTLEEALTLNLILDEDACLKMYHAHITAYDKSD